MGFYSALFETGEVVETPFTEIRFLSLVWPKGLNRNDGEAAWLLDAVKDRGSYESVDQKSFEEETHPKLMVIVKDRMGIWLVGGYSVYAHCNSLVREGRLPSAWGMYVIKYDGRLPWARLVGMGLYVGLKQVEGDRNELPIGGLLRVVSHFFDKSSRRNVEYSRVVEEVGLSFGDNELEVGERAISDLVKTAQRMEGNPILLDYIEEHEEHLKYGMYPSNVIFTPVWHQNVFITFYHQDWWSREPVPVQLLLMVGVMHFYAFQGALLDRRERLREQVIRILRKCVGVVGIAARGNYSVFLKNEASNGGELSDRSAPTMLIIIGHEIFDAILSELSDQLELWTVDLPVNHLLVLEDDIEWENVLPPYAYLSEDNVPGVIEKCLGRVEQCMKRNGYIRPHWMTRRAEEGREWY